MKKYFRHQSGFTLMELMIAVAIIGILAAIAVPSYIDYSNKAKWSELVKATAPVKIAVAEHIADQGSVGSCTAGSGGIPGDVSNVGKIGSLKVLSSCYIEVKPASGSGLKASDDLILQPTFDSGSGLITWATCGAAVTGGYVKSQGTCASST